MAKTQLKEQENRQSETLFGRWYQCRQIEEKTSVYVLTLIPAELPATPDSLSVGQLYRTPLIQAHPPVFLTVMCSIINKFHHRANKMFYIYILNTIRVIHVKSALTSRNTA